MSFLNAILLSLLQGATEFLPVSSSGHLALAAELIGQDPKSDVAFTVLVHLGTLLAIVFAFRRDIGRLLLYMVRDVWAESPAPSFKAAWCEDPRGRMITSVLIATFPTLVGGLLFKDVFESLFDKPVGVGYALLVTSALLGATLLLRKPPEGESEPIPAFPFWMAFVIGCVQALAITPGISRSGSTISVAILLGMHRRTAGEFSFLIAIPAIAGAVVLELPGWFGPENPDLPLFTGLSALLISGLSGYLFLKLLLRFVRSGSFGYFAIYCFLLGLSAILYFA